MRSSPSVDSLFFPRRAPLHLPAPPPEGRGKGFPPFPRNWTPPSLPSSHQSGPSLAILYYSLTSLQKTPIMRTPFLKLFFALLKSRAIPRSVLHQGSYSPPKLIQSPQLLTPSPLNCELRARSHLNLILLRISLNLNYRVHCPGWDHRVGTETCSKSRATSSSHKMTRDC